MTLPEIQTKIKARVWQAIAQSGVDVSALPQADVDKLVGAITGGVLGEVNELLSEASGQPASQINSPVADHDHEQILWEGRPFLSLSVRYQITDERVRIVQGLLGKERYDVELVRVQDVEHKQNLSERAMNMGDVFIRSHDSKKPEIVLENVTDPEQVHEILRRAILKARQKYNLSYREEM